MRGRALVSARWHSSPSCRSARTSTPSAKVTPSAIMGRQSFSLHATKTGSEDSVCATTSASSSSCRSRSASCSLSASCKVCTNGTCGSDPYTLLWSTSRVRSALPSAVCSVFSRCSGGTGCEQGEESCTVQTAGTESTSVRTQRRTTGQRPSFGIASEANPETLMCL